MNDARISQRKKNGMAPWQILRPTIVNTKDDIGEALKRLGHSSEFTIPYTFIMMDETPKLEF